MPGYFSPRSWLLALTRHPAWWARGAIVVAVLIAYRNSFDGALVFDDVSSITHNASLKGPWSLARALSPPDDSTVGGRPLANLTFALNYLVGGDTPHGYHLVNLVIHLLAALALFEIVRLTPFRSSPAGSGPVPGSETVAFAAALLWAVHPVLTSSVTYLSQRTECLMGLCYLLTLLGFIHGVRQSSARWLCFSVFVCAAGMAVKEVMVTAPVMVLLYDRIFFAGSWAGVWRERSKYYFGLAATWGVLAGCLTSGLGHHSVGYGLGVPWPTYALTECTAILTYLRLSVWPHPLIADYGALYGDWPEALLPGLGVLLLVTTTLLLLMRRPQLGFVAVWFFVVLAPTSSVVPVATQPIAENRLYLPLMAVAAFAALAIARLSPRKALGVTASLALPLVIGTFLRNECYRSEAALWADTVEKRPQNPRAHNNHAHFLLLSGRLTEAAVHYEGALRISPDYTDAHYNYSNLLLALGRPAEALAHIERFLAARPQSTDGHLNRGRALLLLSRKDEAAAEFERAVLLAPASPGLLAGYATTLLQSGQTAQALEAWVRVLQLTPDDPEARTNHANTLFALGRHAEAADQYAELVRRRPDDATAHNNYANALDELGRRDDALAHYATALRLRPGYPEAHYNYGNALLAASRPAEAADQLGQAARLRPAYAEAHNSWGLALLRQDQPAEAALHFAEAVRLQPANLAAHCNNARALARLQRWPAVIEACQNALRLNADLPRETYLCASAEAELGNLPAAADYYDRALHLKPDFAEAHQGLAVVCFRQGRPAEAVAHLEEALRLNPQYEEARQNLTRLRAYLSKP